MRGALDEREAGYPTARAEADAKLAADRAALAAEADLTEGVRAARDAALVEARDADRRRRIAAINAHLPTVYKDLLARDEQRAVVTAANTAKLPELNAAIAEARIAARRLSLSVDGEGAAVTLREARDALLGGVGGHERLDAGPRRLIQALLASG